MKEDRESVVAGWQGTYPNHGEEGADGGKSDLSGRNTAGILCDIQNLDESVRGGKSTIAPFGFGGVRCHDR